MTGAEIRKRLLELDRERKKLIDALAEAEGDKMCWLVLNLRESHGFHFKGDGTVYINEVSGKYVRFGFKLPPHTLVRRFKPSQNGDGT